MLEREAQEAEWRARQQRQVSDDVFDVARLRSQRVWALGGIYVEQMSEATYTLEELESWVESYGNVFAGAFGGSTQGFNAVCPALAIRVSLYPHFDNRPYQFDGAAKHLREWIAGQREREVSEP